MNLYIFFNAFKTTCYFTTAPKKPTDRKSVSLQYNNTRDFDKSKNNERILYALKHVVSISNTLSNKAVLFILRSFIR